jgi:hypothetical protein
MEDSRRQVAEKDAAARRATDAQVLEDAERLIAATQSRRSCRLNAPFAELVRITDEKREEHRRRVLGD